MAQAVSMYTYIAEFAKKQGNGKYPNIARADVVAGLKQRMAKPSSVDQKYASLCGPACLAFSILSHLPEMYAAYIMSLYDNGSAMLGRMRVVPSEGCRNARLAGKIEPVDWVGLASPRDSENSDFEYNDPDDEFPGITTPGELEDWFTALRFSGVTNKTNFWFKKDMDDFKKAAILFAQGHSVCLFVNDGVLYGHRTPVLSVPNHWCMLNGNPVLGKNNLISMQIFTWGKNRQVTVTQDVFIGGFYGYVAGRWT